MPDSSIFSLKGRCEICGRERQIAVLASPFGPISHATCLECLQKPAIDEATMEYLLTHVAKGDPSKLKDGIMNWYTFVDGKYIHWNTWVHLRKQRDAK